MRTKQRYLTWVSLFALGLTQPSFATGAVSPLPDVVTVNIGPGWADTNQNQVVTLLPGVQNRYVSSDNTSLFFDGEIFLGWQQHLKNKVDTQLGIAYMKTSSATLNGVVWQAANPRFDNQSYTYNLQHSHVAAKGKVMYNIQKSNQLYINGSLGVGFNSAHAYTNTPVIRTVIASPNFTNNTQTALTYTVGAGLQREVAPHWVLGIGYQFADWGQSHLNAAPGQTVGYGPSLNHFYTNELQFGATYLL